MSDLCANLLRPASSRTQYFLWNIDIDPVDFIDREIPKFTFPSCGNAVGQAAREELLHLAPSSILVDKFCPGLRDWVLSFVSCGTAWLTTPLLREIHTVTYHATADMTEFRRAFDLCYGFLGHKVRSIGSTFKPIHWAIFELFYWVPSLFPHESRVSGQHPHWHDPAQQVATF